MSELVYRGLNDQDRERVARWLAGDPDHRHGDPDFFRVNRPGVEHIAVERDGEVVFYVTLENVCRVHIQFDPDANPIRNARTLKEGLTWLIGNLKQRSYKELVFSSHVPRLIKFCQGVLGFTKNDEDYGTRL